MIVDQLEKLGDYANCLPHIETALATYHALEEAALGRYDFDGGYFFIQEGQLGSVEEAQYEAHQRWLDIHVPLEGHEVLIVGRTDHLRLVSPYDADADIAFYEGPIEDIVKLYPGQACAVFPQDAHKPARHLGRPASYKKLVIKLPVA